MRILVLAVIVATTPLEAGQTVAPAAPAGQNATPRNGAVSGTVIDGSSGAVLTNVIVSLSPRPGTRLPAGYQARQMTDDKGRFAFVRLPDDGTYEIAAAKFGYLDGGYGRDSGPTDPVRTVVIATGAWVANLRVMLWPPATISGVVRDETGEPVVGVFVRALARIRIAGRDDLAAGPLTVTDDHGRYRIPGLLAGRYVIQVPTVQMSVPAATRVGAATTNVPEGVMDIDDSARLVIGRYMLPPLATSGRAMAYAGAFHPSASALAQATPLEVQYGEVRSGIDVNLTPLPAVRVSGTVEAAREVLANLTLRLIPAGMESLGFGGEIATAIVAPNGSFTFLNIPAGSYTLDAPTTFNGFSIASGASRSGGFVGSSSASLPPPPPRLGSYGSSQSTGTVPGVNFSISAFRGGPPTGEPIPPYTARMAVTVGTTDVTGLVIRPRRGATIRGRLTAEPDPAKPVQPKARFFLFLDSVTGQPGLGQPSASVVPETSADFEIGAVQPGEYFLRVQTYLGWHVKTIQWRGRDYTTLPLDMTSGDDLADVLITITNALPSLSGAVRGSDGSIPESGLVVVFPVDPLQRQNTGLWPPRLATAPMQSNGTFSLTGLPAGDYFAAAIDRTRFATWRDPEFLRLLERQAARVTLGWGQTVTRNVTMAVVR